MIRNKLSPVDCQRRIDAVADGVCPGCGGAVVPIKTVDNSDNPAYWPGCETCWVFTFPVPRRMFAVVDQLVRIDGEQYYHGQKPDKGSVEYPNWLSSQRRGMAELVHRIDLLRAAEEAR